MGLANSRRAAAIGIDTAYKNFNVGAVSLLQQRVALLAQGSDAATYSTDKFIATSSQDVGDALGYGSPAHLMAMELLPDSGDGVNGAIVDVYPLPNEATGVAAAGEITPTGTQTTAAEYTVRVGGIESNSFTALLSETPTEIIPKIVTAINGEINMPVIATDGATKVDLVAKHKGTTGNDLEIEIVGTAYGVVFGITAMTGGLVDPDISVATDQFGSVWETIVANQLGSGAWDDLQTFGEGRWGQLVRKPFVALSGSNETDLNTLVAIGDARKADRVNGIINTPGSTSAPYIIAARGIARIAGQANEKPASEYRTLALDTLINGKDSEQFDYDSRDTLWKAGISTTQIENNQIILDNTLTFYHPDGQTNPAYGKVIYIIKLQNIIYNVDLIFDQPEWRQAPLVPDSEVTTNPDARKPKDAVTALNTLTDNLAKLALISDAPFTRENTTAAIDSSNPNRVNTTYPVKLSGNWDIHSIDLQFGFFLGGA